MTSGGSFFVGGYFISKVVPQVIPESALQGLVVECKKEFLPQSEGGQEEEQATSTQADIAHCVNSQMKDLGEPNDVAINCSSAGLVVSLLVAAWICKGRMKHRHDHTNVVSALPLPEV